MKAKAAIILVAVFFIIAPLYGRTLIEARHELARARQLRESGKLEEAIEAYYLAVAWRSPYNQYSKDAVQEFRSFADKELVDRELKLEAYRQLKRGLRSSRSLLYPTSKRDPVLLEVEERISELVAEPATSAFIKEAHRRETNFKAQVIAQLCFWLWVGSVLYVAFSGFTKEGQLVVPKLRSGLPLTILFYLLWLLALSKS